MASVVTNPNKLKLVELNRTKYSDNRKLVNSVRKIFKFCQHNGQACIKEPTLTPSCINRLRFSWARNKKIRKRRHFGIMMVRLMLLLLLIALLTLTSYADSGQKVIKLKIYIAFSFRRYTLKSPFGPFCLKERHGVYVPAKCFILRPVRVVLSMLNERVFVSRANLIIMPLKGDLKSKMSIYTIAKVMTLKYWW